MNFRPLRLFLLSAALLLPLTSFAAKVDEDVYEKLNIFADVLEKIRTSYVEEVTETVVIENAINGMLTALISPSPSVRTGNHWSFPHSTTIPPSLLAISCQLL